MANTRLLLQLHTPGPLPAEVLEVLGTVGSGRARPSHAELPGLYRVDVPPGVDVDCLLAKLNHLPSVRCVEVDTWRQAF